MRYLIPVLALLLCQDAAAQLFKCTDAAGKISYTGTKCSDLGLRDAGEVKDRIQITPAPPTPSQPSSGARPRNDEQPAAQPAAAEAPKEPERRCFTTKNAKGATVTRCNDKPDEE